MKKKYIAMIVIALLIIIAIAGWFIYKQIEKKGREYEIEKISVENYAYFILRQDGKYGVINKTGDIVIHPEYKNARPPAMPSVRTVAPVSHRQGAFPVPPFAASHQASAPARKFLYPQAGRK